MPYYKKITLPIQMGIGLGLGILAGLIVPSLGIDVGTWLKPLGELFITLIRMVVVPLVFVTIVAGVSGIQDAGKFGRVASKSVIYYFLTTAVALGLGLLLANLVDTSSEAYVSTVGLIAKPVDSPNVITTLLNIIPINPVDAMAKGNMLQIIFFAVIFGIALNSIGEKGRPVKEHFEIYADVMIKITNIVMLYSPIGVFGLMAFAVSHHGVSVLIPLGKLIALLYFACLIHVMITYVPLVKFVGGISIRHFFKTMFGTLLIGFTTCSSAASLPSCLAASRKLGSTRAIAGFSIPLGNTINMDGTAIYMAITAMFAASFYGLPLDYYSQFEVLLIGLFASIGTAGVPGAGIIMISIVFIQVGIPLEIIALVAGVDRILDMARTTVNVLGDATGAIVVSALEGDLHSEPYVNEDYTDFEDTDFFLESE